MLEQSLAEREGLPPAARALAEQGERLLLSLLDVEPGDERAVAAALAPARFRRRRRRRRPRARARRAGAGGGARLADRARRRRAARLLRELPVVPREELLASEVPAVTKEGIGWDPQRGELWFAGETAEAVLLELEARRRQLAREAVELTERAAAAAGLAERARRAADEAPAVRRRGSTAGRSIGLQPRPSGCLPRSPSTSSRFEAPLRAEADDGANRRARRGAAAPRRRRGRASARRRRGSASACRPIDVELARIDAEHDEAARRLEAAGAEPAEGDDRDELAAKRRAARAPPRAARPGQPAREGGVRGGEGAPRRALDAASRPRAQPRRAREAPARPHRDGRAPLRGDLRRGRAATSPRSRRRSSPAARAGCG